MAFKKLQSPSERSVTTRRGASFNKTEVVAMNKVLRVMSTALLSRDEMNAFTVIKTKFVKMAASFGFGA